MNKPTLYLETSFINYLADPLKRNPRIRRDQLSSRTWWRTQRRSYQLQTSDLSYRESCLDYPNARLVRLRLRCFAGLKLLRCAPATLQSLADALRQPSGPMPSDALLDSQHVALAAISGCRYFLTWNQKHIANPFTFGIVDNIIQAYGYQTPIIATPEQFLDAPPR
jgi:hypothetical protein